MKTISVRAERPDDFLAIDDLVQDAYQNIAYSNHREQRMIRRLRDSPAYVPELSLVAEVDGELAGHIMLTRIGIRDADKVSPSLALGPLSVPTACQGRGVGSALVNAAHERARALQFTSIILVGIGGYYGRFAYVPLDTFPIQLPFDVRPENRMALVLIPDGLHGVSGMVEYAPEWMET